MISEEMREKIMRAYQQQIERVKADARLLWEQACVEYSYYPKEAQYLLNHVTAEDAQVLLVEYDERNDRSLTLGRFADQCRVHREDLYRARRMRKVKK